MNKLELNPERKRKQLIKAFKDSVSNDHTLFDGTIRKPFLNTPDRIFFMSMYSYTDDEAVPFVYLRFRNENKLFYGEPGTIHNNIRPNVQQYLTSRGYKPSDITGYKSDDKYSDNRNYQQGGFLDFADEEFLIKGRYFVIDVPYINQNCVVFGFWFMHKYPMELTNEIVYQVCRDNHLFDRRIFIINGSKPLIEYNSFMPGDDEIEDNTEQAILHMLPSGKKWKETAGFRNIRDKQLGKKLTMSNGKEMPMAQYNALRYVDESVINESVDKNLEEKVRKAVRDMIKNGELPKYYDEDKAPLEMAEHYAYILKKVFGDDYEIYHTQSMEDDDICCAVIDDEFKKNGGHYDMDDCENHLESVKKWLDKIIKEEYSIMSTKKIYLTESQIEYIKNKLLLEGDSRLKAVDRIIDTEFNGLLNPDDVVRGEEYYVNGNLNTTWRQYLLYSLRHTFGLMTNNDVQYLPLVAKLAFGNEVQFEKTNDNGRQIALLHKIVMLLKKQPELFQQLNKQRDSITFSQIYEQLKSQIESVEQSDAATANQIQERSDYDIIEVPDFKTAKKYGDYSCSGSKLCYTQGKSTWEQYKGKNGKNRVYVCLKRGWENIPEKPSEGNPYDEYGTSMIFVFINPEGDISTSNCRWNHENVAPYNGDADHAFTKTTLAKTVGRNFNATFKPYDKKQLYQMGVVTFEDVPELLAQGVDPDNIFDYVDVFVEGFCLVRLNGKYNFINPDNYVNPESYSNTSFRLISPNKWFDHALYFNNDYAVVGLNGRKNFINREGKILSPNLWFDYASDFYNRNAKVMLNNSFGCINANGEINWNVSPNVFFDYISKFNDGYAQVRLDDVFNFIDTENNLLWTKPIGKWFDDVNEFHDGYAEVIFRDKEFFLRKDGILCDYETKEPIQNINENTRQIETKRKRIYLTENQIDYLKKELEKARKETNTNPTEGQKEAGNYKMGRVNVYGFEIAIENPKGSYRKGKDKNGKAWKCLMHNDYGYFTHTKAVDGDAVDVFLGKDLDCKTIFAIDQVINGKFDETKIMFGFKTEEEAKKAYLSNYNKGWKGLGKVTEVSIDDFKGWLYDGYKQRKPFSEYNEIKKKKLNEMVDFYNKEKLLLGDDGDYVHVINETFDDVISEYENKNAVPFLTRESIDEFVDDNELGDVLQSFDIQKQLNPKFWINGKLNSRVRLRLLDIADTFFDSMELNWVKSKDIIMTGSLANYNWSKFSDIDLHIIVDFKEVDDRVEFVKDYFDSKKSIWNSQHEDLKIYGYPVELYVQDENEEHTASGVYSLEKDKWLREPERDSLTAVKLDKECIVHKTKNIIDKIDSLESECEGEKDEAKLDTLSAKVKGLFDKIKGMRKESLKSGSELGIGNIIFKTLRRLGYIGKLVDLKRITFDKINSIK